MINGLGGRAGPLKAWPSRPVPQVLQQGKPHVLNPVCAQHKLRILCTYHEARRFVASMFGQYDARPPAATHSGSGPMAGNNE
jgi:hypothetical protein